MIRGAQRSERPEPTAVKALAAADRVVVPERKELTVPEDRSPRTAKKPVPRVKHGRASWLRRTGRRARGALLGALLVGASFGLTGSGASDQSAIQVARPPIAAQATSSTHTTTPTTPTTPPPVVHDPAPPPTTVAPAPVPPTPDQRLDAILAAGNVRLEYPRDFADPFVLRDGDATYFYATNAHLANVPVLDARAMLAGAAPTEAFPTENLGRWAVPNISHVWAPSVAKLPDGRFALFYSAMERASGRMAVGVAYASSPMGPFRDDGGAPLLSVSKSGAAGRGGVIDASVFSEDGKTFVVFKNDGNAVGAETAVWIQEFSPGAGAPVKLLGDAGHQGWEEADYTHPRALIEGPRLASAGGKYYLFYCANDWASPNYGVNYAVADHLLGPYTRNPGPWMRSEPGRFGPGGPELFNGPGGEMFLAYHAWNTPQASASGADARRLVIEPIDFEHGMPERTVG